MASLIGISCCCSSSHLLLRRSFKVVACVGPISQNQKKQTTTTKGKPWISAAGADNAAWRSFAECVSGEWDGYGAEFSSSGHPCELPHMVVPEAFREWDVQLYDWQTQCPTITNESLHYKLIRLLPTVGCEADASTQYSIDNRKAGDQTQFLAYHTNGSYIAVWPGRRVLKENFETGSTSKLYACDINDQHTFEVEHCLIQDEELKFRVRILQRMVMKSENGNASRIPVLENITIQREKWESVFRNGEVLGGCATSGSAFATSSAVQGSDILGDWQYESFSCQSQSLNGIEELIHTGSGKERLELSGEALPLPKGVWSEMKELEDGHFSLAVGWLIDKRKLICSSCVFSNCGKIKRACIKFEKRAD